ncbi:MAG: hypothetical protein ACD_40C00283G0008 [uncultured bacterium]|nr:MAG: hypothetical protein ACD_40C00283G0008 [uncultured bacterium]
MLLSSFQYNLPQNLIAQSPAHPRDHARLMLINRQTQEISHHHVYDLPKLLSTIHDLSPTIYNLHRIYSNRSRTIIPGTSSP